VSDWLFFSLAASQHSETVDDQEDDDDDSQTRCCNCDQPFTDVDK